MPLIQKLNILLKFLEWCTTRYINRSDYKRIKRLERDNWRLRRNLKDSRYKINEQL